MNRSMKQELNKLNKLCAGKFHTSSSSILSLRSESVADKTELKYRLGEKERNRKREGDGKTYHCQSSNRCSYSLGRYHGIPFHAGNRTASVLPSRTSPATKRLIAKIRRFIACIIVNLLRIMLHV